MAGFDPEAVKQLLGLPANVRVNALVAVGKGAEEGFPHHRHPVSRLAKFV
jgi:nitroreductase